MSAKDQSADIEQLIAEFEKSGLRELHVIRDGFEIYLSTDPDTGGIGAQVTPVAPPDCASFQRPSTSLARQVYCE